MDPNHESLFMPNPTAQNPQNIEHPKAATGIRGLDDITNGGLPRGRATLLAGGPGCGKTVLALQILVNGAQRDEPGIFVAFEEDSARIVANAATFGWNLPELEKKISFSWMPNCARRWCAPASLI